MPYNNNFRALASAFALLADRQFGNTSQSFSSQLPSSASLRVVRSKPMKYRYEPKRLTPQSEA